jgi:hypothetical protein
MFHSEFPATGQAVTLSHGEWVQATLGQTSAPASAGVNVTYPTTFYPSAETPANATALLVQSGQELSNIDIQLVPTEGHSVTGAIRGPAGPLSNVGVHLRRLGSQQGDEVETAMAVSDTRGRFVMPVIPPGRYRLQVLRLPVVGRPQFFTPRNTGGGPGLIFLRTDPLGAAGSFWAQAELEIANRDVTDLELVAEPGIRVTGAIRFQGSRGTPGGEVLRRTWIEIDRADGRPQILDVTNEIGVTADGSFRSIELPPGRYVVRATEAPAGWTLDSAMLDGQDVSLAPFDLTASTHPIEITFVDRSSHLTGSVRTDRGAVPAHAVVGIFPTSPGAWVDYGTTPRAIRNTPVDDHGHYSIEGLPAGQYFVAAFPDSMMDRWQTIRLFDDLSRTAHVISIGNSRDAEVDLILLEARR